jgi:acetone carboxylase gamma subunit
MTTYPVEIIQELVNGRLPWESTKEMMSGFKDADRFFKYLAVMQASVSWQEKILLPIGEHLFIVQQGQDRIVKASCGQEFGDYRINWKLAARILVRDTPERLNEIYPARLQCDPSWMEIREFICPGCGTLLEVEAVIPGYPITFDFLPDLETFYSDWLQQPLS